jgi:beta-lactamase regulating signal transducer with metallopeptidase domain
MSATCMSLACMSAVGESARRMPFVMHIGSALLAETLTGTLLAFAMALLLRCLPKLPATVRSSIWMVVLCTLLLLPLASSLAGTHGGAAVGKSIGIALDARWLAAFAAAWLTLTVLRAAQLVRSARWLAIVASRAEPIVSPAFEDALKLHAAELKEVRLCLSRDVDVPCVAGFRRPLILLPHGLLEELGAKDLHHILQHELEHVRRRDSWLNLLQKCALVAFPLHPGLWLAERRLSTERELACDERVVRSTGAPKAYAACLANLAERSLVQRRVKLAMAALGQRSDLGRRIRRILAVPGSEWTQAKASVVAGLLVVALFAGSIEMGRANSFVQFTNSRSAESSEMLASLGPAPVGTPAQIAAALPAAPRLATVRSRRTRSRVAAPALAVAPAVMAGSGHEPAVLVDMNHSLAVSAKPAVFMQRPLLQDSLLKQRGELEAIPFAGGWLIVRL